MYEIEKIKELDKKLLDYIATFDPKTPTRVSQEAIFDACGLTMDHVDRLYATNHVYIIYDRKLFIANNNLRHLKARGQTKRLYMIEPLSDH